MHVRTLFFLVLVTATTAACGSLDTKDWLKVNQRYTKEEFQQDYRECARDEKKFEPCMRQRGWVPVNPSKADTPTPEPTQRGPRY